MQLPCSGDLHNLLVPRLLKGGNQVRRGIHRIGCQGGYASTSTDRSLSWKLARPAVMWLGIGRDFIYLVQA